MSLPALVTVATLGLMAVALVGGPPTSGSGTRPLTVAQHAQVAAYAQIAYAQGGSSPRLLAITRALAMSSELFAEPLTVAGCVVRQPPDGRGFEATCHASNPENTREADLAGSFNQNGTPGSFGVTGAISAETSEGGP